jgi:AraC-like DNA-binding protein
LIGEREHGIFLDELRKRGPRLIHPRPHRLLALIKNFLNLQVMPTAHPFVFETFGLRICHGMPPLMRRLHSHTELEFNLVIRGRLTYRFAGEPVTLKAGTLYVFGGVTPHELEDVSPDAEYFCLTVPLTEFIRWRLPENVHSPLLRGEILGDVDKPHDERRFARWKDDLLSRDPRRARVILPEVQARMERMALSSGLSSRWRRQDSLPTKGTHLGVLLRVEKMLHRISANFAEPLALKELAEDTGWHPHYAAGQFKAWIGVSPGEFLLRQRVAHARQLLVTTEAKVIEVSEACGFPSQSSFYAAFTRLTGMTPAAYRRKPKQDQA